MKHKSWDDIIKPRGYLREGIRGETELSIEQGQRQGRRRGGGNDRRGDDLIPVS
jgi:hypothetical protein